MIDQAAWVGAIWHFLKWGNRIHVANMFPSFLKFLICDILVFSHDAHCTFQWGFHVPQILNGDTWCWLCMDNLGSPCFGNITNGIPQLLHQSCSPTTPNPPQEHLNTGGDFGGNSISFTVYDQTVPQSDDVSELGIRPAIFAISHCEIAYHWE